MKKIILFFLLFYGIWSSSSAQTRPSLGTAANFTVLAATNVSNTDVTRVSGNVGVWPGTTISGFGPNMIIGNRHQGDAVAEKAQTDLRNAYTSIEALVTTPGKNVTGSNLNGQTLTAGVYTFDNATTLSGTISLDAANDPNAIFIFQVKGSLTVAPNTIIRLVNNARRMNIYWQVADNITVGSRSTMAGNFLAKNSIRLEKEATVNGGRLLSLDGEVALNKNFPVTTSTELSITKTKSLGQNGVNPYSVGELVTFTIVARNLGPIDDYNVRIVDQIDISLEYLEATAQSSIPGKQVNNFLYNTSSRILQWTTNEFKTDETVTLSVKVRILNPGGIGNTATILGTVTDDNFDNNSASISPAICAKITNPGPITGPKSVCIGSSTNVFSVAPIPGAQSYNWVLPTGWEMVPPADGSRPGNSITVEVPVSTPGNPVAAGGTISVAVNNGCGDSEPSLYEVTTSPALPSPPGAIASDDPAAFNPCIRNPETFFTYKINAIPNADEYEWTIGMPGNPTNNGKWEIVSGQGTPQITVKAGEEEVIISVRAKNGCGPTAASTVKIDPSLGDPIKPAAITGPTAICVGVPTIFTTSSETPRSRFTWTVPTGWNFTGQGTNQITVTAPVSAINVSDSIKVVAVNNCGTSKATGLLVQAVQKITAGPITGLTTPCIGTAITYRVAAPGATSFEWRVTGELEVEGAISNDSVTVLVKGPGTIFVNAINACGPSNEQSLQVTPDRKLDTPSVINTTSTAPCAGTNGLTYSVAEVPGAIAYNWQILDANGQPAAGWAITGTSPDQKTITVTAGSQPATISVTVSNNCGVSNAQTLAVVPVATLPPAPGPIRGDINVCADNSDLRYSVSAVAGLTYTWSVPAGDGWEIISGQGTANVVIKAGSTEGLLTVKTANACGENPEISQKQIIPSSIKAAMPGPIVSSKTAVCPGEQNITYSVDPIEEVSVYIWTVPEGWTITSGQTTNTITVNAGTSGGQVYVTAHTNCGPGDTSAPFMAVVDSIPTASMTITGETIPCTGSTENKYSINPVPGATSYVWQVPDGWAITSGAGTTEITVRAGETAGNITVKAINTCFESTPATLPVAPNTNGPAGPLAITGSNTICRNQTDLTYSIEPVANASGYVWTVPDGWEITAGQGTTSIKVNAKTNAGNIMVMAKNGCSLSSEASTLPVIVSNQVAISLGPISGNRQVCAGDENLSYSVVAVNGVTGYLWEVPEANGWRIIAGQGTPTVQIQAGKRPGTISVRAASADCGSGPASNLPIAVPDVPTKLPQIVGASNQCPGNTRQIYQIAAVNGATNYTWKVPQDWKIEANQGTNAIQVSVGIQSGTVEVIITTACGPVGPIVLAVTSSEGQDPLPGPIGGDSKNLICKNQSNITYTINPVPGAVSYRWEITPANDWVITGGQGTTSIQVTAGTQAATVSVRAITGCGLSDVSAVDVNPGETSSISVSAITGSTVTCGNQAGLVYSVEAVGGATGYTWTLPGDWKITAGANTNRITVTSGSASGTVSVVAFNTCTSTLPGTLAVAINGSTPAPAQIRDLSSPCGGLVYEVDAVPNTSNYIWAVPEGWSIVEGQGTIRIKVNAPAGSKEGTVSVATQSASCTSTPATLVANPALGLSDMQIANVFSPNGDGVNDTWSITNISNYPDNEVVIINRWGSEVFKRKSYQNNWNGGELTDGTYFYILKVKICDGSYQTQKGYVMIMRQ